MGLARLENGIIYENMEKSRVCSPGKQLLILRTHVKESGYGGPHCNPSAGEEKTRTVPRGCWSVGLAWVVSSRSEGNLVSKGRQTMPVK